MTPLGGCGCQGARAGDAERCSRCQGRRYTNDVAKLYSVNVTNVLGGVASFCRRCAPEPAGSCAPCPPGSAVDRSSGTCQPCPPGTYLRGHPSDGTPTCHPCGPGTRSNQVTVPGGGGSCPHERCQPPPAIHMGDAVGLHQPHVPKMSQVGGISSRSSQVGDANPQGLAAAPRAILNG